jgi:hypothetical protein
MESSETIKVDELGKELDKINEEMTYFDLENKIKQLLNETIKDQLNLQFSKLDNKEKEFINKKYLQEIQINWIFNINSVQKERGDLCSSSLQKFYHFLFTPAIENPENNPEIAKKNDEISHFKNLFLELLNTSVVVSLNSSLQLRNYLGKIEIKNGFLNIYLKGPGKLLVDEMKSTNKKEKEAMKEPIQKDQFTVCNNFTFFIFKV